MNILFTVPWDQAQGGVTHVVTSLARVLEEHGHQASFLFPGERWRLRHGRSRRGFSSTWCRLRKYAPSGAPARARISWLSAELTSLPQLAHFCRARQIDLVNVHYPTDSFALLADLAGKLEVPLVVSAHGSDLLPASVSGGAGLHRLLARASDVVVPSNAFRCSVLDLYPAIGHKISCIYNGYDSRELSLPPSAIKLGPRIGSLVVCIAAHIHKKGIDVLLRALHQVADADLRLRVIGDGELRSELQQLSEKLGLTGRVTFVGSKDRLGIFQELRDCDVLVLPSRHPSESFGLAALEAMACGKPVVASHVGGLPELVEHDVTGFLVPPEDSSALAIALERLHGDRQLRLRLGDAARNRARRFTVESTAEQYEALFAQRI